jgi:hypothetical protein
MKFPFLFEFFTNNHILSLENGQYSSFPWKGTCGSLFYIVEDDKNMIKSLFQNLNSTNSTLLLSLKDIIQLKR